MSANGSTPTLAKQYATHGDGPSPPTPQQAKKKIKNKKGGGGGGGSLQTPTDSADLPFPSFLSSFFHYHTTVESHRDALRKHLGAKTFKKLIDTYVTAAGFLSIHSLIFFFLTSSTLPADDTASYLPNIIYFPLIRWWYLRLWLGVSLWHFVATCFLEWTLHNKVLPLIFAAYAPSKLTECIQHATNNNNNNESEEQDANDDPSDAFVKSAPRDNGSNYSYSSLINLLQWHHHGIEDAPRIYLYILRAFRFVAELWLLSFATGGGWLWLGAAFLYGAMNLFIVKFPTSVTRFNPVNYLLVVRRALPLVGVVRVGAQLIFNIAQRGYAKYYCPDDFAVCVSAAASTGSWYKGSDVEFILHVLFQEYSFLGVLFVTPSLVFLSYVLSKVRTRHLPRWWWVVCPKREVVAVCVFMAQVIVSVAWIPATRWVTNYTIEFLAGKENNNQKYKNILKAIPFFLKRKILFCSIYVFAVYGYMLYDKSIINIPYFKHQADAYPSFLNPLLVIFIYSALRTTWHSLVWQPWLPVNLLALALSVSQTLQRKVPLLSPNHCQILLSGGMIDSKIARLLPLTSYFLGGRWSSSVAVLFPPISLSLYSIYRKKYGRGTTIEEEENLQKRFSFNVSMMAFLCGVASIFQIFKSMRFRDDAAFCVLGFILLSFTKLSYYRESFINWLPMPSLDALLDKLSGGRFGTKNNDNSSSEQHQKQQTGAPAGPSSSNPASASSDAIPPMMEALPVPAGATKMVRSILAATNHYSVLGMHSPATTTDEDLRKAKRTLSLATHPDKAGGAPGAVDACQRVLQAADVLLDPEKRKIYDEEIAYARFAASGAATELEEELADMIFEQTGVDISQTDYIMVSCECCALKAHQAPVVPDRTAAAARYCEQHKTRHAAEEQESWIEREFAWNGWLPGSILRFYMCHQGKVYDCSAAAECAGLLQIWAKSGIQANTHENYYHKVVPSNQMSGAKAGKSAGAGGGSKAGRKPAAAGGNSGGASANNKPKSKKGKKGRR